MSSQNITLLNQLHVTFFEFITPFLSGSDIGNLYLCGNTSLNLRLTNPGVVKTFDFETHNLVTRAWPSIMAVFPTIETIAVKVAYSPGTIGMIGVDISTIPKTAKKIHLEFADSWYSLLEHMPNGYRLDKMTFNAKDHRLVKVKDLWPNLEELTWMDSFGSGMREEEATSMFVLCAMPKTLTSLKLGPRTEFSISEINHLPPMLTKLTAHMTPSTYVTLLGPTFGSKCATSSSSSSSQSISFPISLKYLELTGSPEIIAPYLPKSLLELDGHFSPACWHFLPSGLEMFTFRTWMEIHPSDIKRLPQKLERLLLPYSSMGLEALEALPKTIRELEVSYLSGIQLSDSSISSVIDSLPPLLSSSKKFFSIISDWPSAWSSLPKNMEEMTLNSFSAQPLSSQITKKLPSHLKSLKIPRVYVRDETQYLEAISSLPNAKLESLILPPKEIVTGGGGGAVRIGLTVGVGEDQSIVVLSDRQRCNPHFKTLICPAPSDPNVLLQLPSSITELELTNISVSSSSLDIQSFKWHCSFFLSSLTVTLIPRSSLDKIFPNLPHTLLKLSITSSILTNGQKTSSLLPPNLTQLNLHQIEDLRDEFLRLLPSKLVAMSLRARSSMITSYGLSCLPSTMGTISLTPIPSPEILEALYETRPYIHAKKDGSILHPSYPATHYVEQLRKVKTINSNVEKLD
jgi:hypothetical protein